MIFISLLIFIEDGLPIFFKQKRIGINKYSFTIFKFRTMKKNTGDIPTHLLQNRNSFITNIGYFLRKLSLDELPQLFNIILGDMTLIGPRPALYNQKDLIDLREEKGIHSLKPGLTGWAQVNGRDEISIRKKVDFDYYYLKNKNLFLDIRIFFLTIYKVLFRKDVS
tara:strand:- start:3696 stop:4193 length:498 start_codon:yes stop_codon:yes gene_type:complete